MFEFVTVSKMWCIPFTEITPSWICMSAHNWPTFFWFQIWKKNVKTAFRIISCHSMHGVSCAYSYNLSLKKLDLPFYHKWPIFHGEKRKIFYGNFFLWWDQMLKQNDENICHLSLLQNSVNSFHKTKSVLKCQYLKILRSTIFSFQQQKCNKFKPKYMKILN